MTKIQYYNGKILLRSFRGKKKKKTTRRENLRVKKRVKVLQEDATKKKKLTRVALYSEYSVVSRSRLSY